MPGQDTITDITARLFFRSDVERIGIALITSMFLFGESNRYVFDDYRSQVDDSDGLQITSSEGTQIWRTLSNPLALANSFFAQDRSVPFGLIQRQRDFSMYEDAEARYERRPSLSVQPSSDWGKGNIQLVDIPSDIEQNDNIVAFWTPDRPIKGGDSLDVAYRLLWGDLAGDQSLLARTVSTRRTPYRQRPKSAPPTASTPPTMIAGNTSPVPDAATATPPTGPLAATSSVQ